MAAIVKSPVAMAAMWRSDTAIKALQANATAWQTSTGASSAVMGKTVAILANPDPSGYADMTAVAASQVAMAAIIGNSTALNAVVTSSGCYGGGGSVCYGTCGGMRKRCCVQLSAQQGNFRHNFRSVHSFRLVYTLCKAVYCAQMVLFLQQWHLWYSDLLRWCSQPTVYRYSAL